MYLRGKDGQPHRRVIFTKEEKEAVLTEMHAGHFGVKRMIAKINLRFFKDVDSWVIRANYFIWKNDEMKARPMKPRSSFAPSWGHHQLRVTSVEANNILQLDGQPLKALTPYTSVKPMRQYVKANHRVTGPSLTSLINPADVKKLQTGPRGSAQHPDVDPPDVLHYQPPSNFSLHHLQLLLLSCCHYLLRKFGKGSLK